jgi:hypothetical protein
MTTTDLLIYRPVVGCPPHIEEEFPMTMQVGMVGTDGILIASDTKWMSTLHGGGSSPGVRQTFNSSTPSEPLGF